MDVFIPWAFTTIILALLWFCYALRQEIKEQVQQFADVIADLEDERRQEREQFATERKDLYDRIQAGTLTQYKEYAPEPEEKKEEEDETVDIEDAREDIENG